MGPTLVILTSPSLNDNLRFTQAAKQFPIQAFIPQLVVEALDVPILMSLPLHPAGCLTAVYLAPLGSHGEPGFIYIVFTWLSSSQSCTAYAMNSGPLSLRRCCGLP